MNRTEAITAMAELIAGLQVPVSCIPVEQRVQVFGAAHEPWERIYAATAGFGWTSAEKVEARLQEILA